ncbi:MAG: amino acid permease [Streptococcaceae bacterium]|nr:amino acid permease [Streptococcaceae bacterium]
MEEKQELKRSLGFFPVLAMVMGTVIGAGVFFKAGTISSMTGNAGLQLLVWTLGGLLSIAGGLTAAELAAAIPETGGLIRYIERGFGKAWGFVTGWAQTLINYPAQIAALATVFAVQFLNLFGMKQTTGAIVIIGILAALSVTLLNFISAKVAGTVQSVTLVIKLIPIVLIILIGLFINPHAVNFSIFPIAVGEAVANHPSLAQTIGLGLLATMFAYDGWIYVGNVAGEMKNPKRDLPRAIIFGLIAITLIYVLINAAYIHTLGVNQLATITNDPHQGTAVLPGKIADLLFGGWAGKLITIGIMISVYGTINGYTMTGSRATYAFARENKIKLFSLSKLSKNSVPVNAAILQLIIATVMLLANFIPASGDFAAAGGAFGLLTNLCIFANWLFYTMVFVALFILRKKEPELERPYKVPLYPVVPAIAIIGGVFILVMTLTGSFLGYQLPALISIVVIAIGFPIYNVVKGRK